MAVGVGKHLLRQVESPSTRFHSPASLDLFTGWQRDPQVHEVAQPNVWVLSNPLPCHVYQSMTQARFKL